MNKVKEYRTRNLGEERADKRDEFKKEHYYEYRNIHHEGHDTCMKRICKERRVQNRNRERGRGRGREGERGMEGVRVSGRERERVHIQFVSSTNMYIHIYCQGLDSRNTMHNITVHFVPQKYINCAICFNIHILYI